MADDDEDDCMLAREALAESRLANDLYLVRDGEELMDYLHQRGQYTDLKLAPRPGFDFTLISTCPRKTDARHYGKLRQTRS
nr:hypothetical protein [Chroococcidiopsis cubana]